MPRGGKRKGAGRPAISEYETTRYTFLLEDRQVRWLERFAREREFNGRSSALRALIDHAIRTTQKK